MYFLTLHNKTDVIICLYNSSLCPKKPKLDTYSFFIYFSLGLLLGSYIFRIASNAYSAVGTFQKSLS